MSAWITARLLFGGAVAYLVILGWSITNATYDIWGALVVVPLLTLVGVVVLRRMFEGDLRPVGVVMMIGLPLKFAGAAARYWVGFEAYGGGIDAQRYHDYAVPRATAVWSGELSPFALFPEGTGTPFTEGVAALVYTLTGVSKLGGFMAFAFLAYIGTALFVKAACLAVPSLLQRRYAVLCILAPSIVYWPSSIGKEAWMFLTLGLASYGIAVLLARQGLATPLLLAATGLLGAAMVRPHMSALWIIGALPALVVGLFGRSSVDERRSPVSQRVGVVVVIAVAAVGLSIAASATLRYLNFAEDEETGSDAVASIIEETTRRTVQAQSNFEPPSVDNPANWPYAAVRTLTRPLIVEARGSGQLLSAFEMTLFIGIGLASIRRLRNLPRLILTTPYITFAMTVLFFGGLAFTSFANLGVLTRQRTLLFPFMLLLLCLPLPAARRQKNAPDLERFDEVLDSPWLAAPSGGRELTSAWTNTSRPSVERDADGATLVDSLSVWPPPALHPAERRGDDLNWDRR